MIETVTIITLCFLYLIFFRPGKTPKLENPLVIERTGLYRITMAPQLNLAQPFIEAIATRMRDGSVMPTGEMASVFAVRDKQVVPKGADYYVLTIMLSNGMLCFEAASPQIEKEDVVDRGHETDRPLVELAQAVATENGINITLL